jgi:hypothetical protein
MVPISGFVFEIGTIVALIVSEYAIVSKTLYFFLLGYFRKNYKSKTLDSKVSSILKIELKDCLVRGKRYIRFPGTKFLIQIGLQLSISCIKKSKLNQK